MSAKLITGVLTALVLTSNVYAAPTNGAKEVRTSRESMKLNEASKSIEDFQKNYRAKNGDFKSMSLSEKKTFSQAVKSYSDVTPEVSSDNLMRLLLAPDLEYLPGKSILSSVESLAKVKASGTAEQKEAADLQLELMNLVGKKYEAADMTSKEFEAARILLSIDLQAVPAAIPVVSKIVKSMRNGQSISTSVKEGMTGMKGSLEDFINLCGKNGGKLLRS